MSDMMVSCATSALKYNMLAKYSINDEVVVGVDSAGSCWFSGTYYCLYRYNINKHNGSEGCGPYTAC